MKTELEAIIDQMISRGILFDEAVKEFEKNFILKVLDRHNNNLSKAAEALGIHRNTLSKRMIEYTNGVNGNGHKNGHKRAQPAQPKRRTRGQSRIEGRG
ncbi:MAG TPA: helix-turn-helix domain-containing protein [Blastocatellia bacterium]|nr:helix-turn-helix domain-containing protein [Blastocatellia bacterium]